MLCAGNHWKPLEIFGNLPCHVLSAHAFSRFIPFHPGLAVALSSQAPTNWISIWRLVAGSAQDKLHMASAGLFYRKKICLWAHELVGERPKIFKKGSFRLLMRHHLHSLCRLCHTALVHNYFRSWTWEYESKPMKHQGYIRNAKEDDRDLFVLVQFWKWKRDEYISKS